MLMEALGLSITLHFIIIGSYYGRQYLFNEEEASTVRVRIMKYSELGPPPSLTNISQVPSVGIRVAVAKPPIGIPVPVPDIEISPERTIATQNELSNTSALGSGDESGSGSGDGVVDGGNSALPGDIKIEEDEPDINAFIPLMQQCTICLPRP